MGSPPISSWLSRCLDMRAKSEGERGCTILEGVEREFLAVEEVVVVVVAVSPPSIIAVGAPPLDELLLLSEGRRLVEVARSIDVVAVTPTLDAVTLLVSMASGEVVRSRRMDEEAPTVVAVTVLLS